MVNNHKKLQETKKKCKMAKEELSVNLHTRLRLSLIYSFEDLKHFLNKIFEIVSIPLYLCTIQYAQIKSTYGLGVTIGLWHYAVHAVT